MSSDLDSLYQKEIRMWAQKLRQDRYLNNITITETSQSKICGSRMSLQFLIQNNEILDIGWKIRACILGMASAACFVEFARDDDVLKTIEVGQKLEHLLKGASVSFSGRWDKLNMFVAAQEFPSRHDSILLPFTILMKVREELGPVRS